MRSISRYFLCLMVGLATFFSARLPAANAQPLAPARTPNNGPDLAMQLQASAASVRANQIITYMPSVQNVGQSMSGSATIRVTDTLPVSSIYYSLPAECTLATVPPANAVVVCSFVAKLVAGGSYQIGILGIRAPNYATTLTNTAVVTGVPDSNLDNNTATAVTVVTNDVDLYLDAPGNPAIFGGPDPLVPPNTDVAYDIVIGNNTGVSVAASPRLTFTLPSNASLVSAAAPLWTCMPSGTLVLCNYNTSLAPGEVATNTLTIIVRNNTGNSQPLNATAQVWALNQLERSPADNMATRTINVVNCNPDRPSIIPVSVSTTNTVLADGNMYAEVLVQLQSDCPGNPAVTASSVLTLTSSRGGLDTITLAPGAVNPTTTGSVVFRVRSQAVGSSTYTVQGSTGSYVYTSPNMVTVRFDLLRWFLAFVQR